MQRDARDRARLQARRPAARRRGGQRRRAAMPGGIPTKVGVPLEPEPARRRGRRRRAARAARGDRGEPRRARSPTSTASSCTISGSRSGARARSSASSSAAFPPDELAHFRAEFRWLQQVTGDVRDLDVYVLEFDEMRALVPEACRPTSSRCCACCARGGRRRAGEMVRALRSERTATLLPTGAGSSTGSEASAGGRATRRDAGRSATLAGERIAKVYRRMLKMGDAIDALEPGRATTTSCARRARSSATCSSCSARRCIPRRSSSR